MRAIRFLLVLVVVLPLIVSSIQMPYAESPTTTDSGMTVIDLGDGNSIEVAPDEVLLKYVISAAPTERTGTGSALFASEYGTRTDTFTDRTMVYYPSGSITTANLSVPLGDDWEGYRVDASVTGITENRTWLDNYQLTTDQTWSFGTSYVEGWFDGNNRVQYFTSAGAYGGQWGSRGTGNGQFIDPWGAAFDSLNNLYVADTQNNRIQVFSSTGTYLRQWGSYGTGTGEFNRPTGVAIDAANLVYVVDSGNHRIQVFSSLGVYQRQWGSSGIDDGEFRSPTGIAYSRYNSYIYVTDTGNDRVQYFTTLGVRQGGWTGLLMPTGIAVRPSTGQVYVADTTNNRIQRRTATGGSTSNLITGLSTPMGVAISSDSAYLYVCNSGGHNVRRYSPQTGALQTSWGTDGSGSGQFRFNYGIAVSSAGSVYVCESGGMGRMDANWLSTGHGTGNPSSIFQIDGYYHDAGSGLYGYWYNPGDKAFVRQDLTLDRGDVTWAGISMDYYGDCRGWSSYMTGFFELFVSIDDPDNGGHYLWSRQFDAIADDNVWYSTGLVPVDPTYITTPTVSIMAGLRVAQSEWYRSADIRPEGRLDNIVLYIKAKATPESIGLEMNGVVVDNVIVDSNPVYGLGTATDIRSTPWSAGYAYANFSWTPFPNPPSPNLEISVEIDVGVTVSAKRMVIQSINDTESFTYGDNYLVQNATSVRWETNHYVAVPGGYGSEFFFNVSLPTNRDIDYIAQPNYRYVNLTSGWSLGDAGDEVLNVSVYEITLTGQNGFWYMKGSSPNMISDLRVWDPDSSAWVREYVFRAGDDTRFMAYLSPAYASDVVQFTVYNPAGGIWTTLTAVVNASGYATTDYVEMDALTAPVGAWEVQAFVVDSVSGAGLTRNAGFYRRGFSVQHATDMSVRYPSEGVWSYNVTYGDLVLLQLQVTDSDTTTLLAGGVMTYSWAGGSGTVNDLGTGEYGITLNTALLSSNGAFQITLAWSKIYYDSLVRAFTLNVIFTSELLSPDAPGVAVPRGYDAVLMLFFKDQRAQPITGATITCNWTLDDYDVIPVVGSPGYYTLAIETESVTLDTYAVAISAYKDYVEPRTIILSVQVRELFTSAIPSTSLLSLPVGYTTSFTITYMDTDHGTPISDSESSIALNWTGTHGSYSVTETATAGVYRVDVFSIDTDTLETYVVRVDVQSYGAQNHTFYVSIVLRTHLTSFYLTNPISPTPYTGNVEIRVVYYDVDASSGIENGSVVGYYVFIYVESSGLPTVLYTVVNGSVPGEYVITLPAAQWGSIGIKDLVVYAEWTGPTVKYYNRTISSNVRITAAPTDIYIEESPLVTPYNENVTFSIVYFDVGANTGVVNTTGNVHITVIVLTTGHSLNQSVMVISEVDSVGSPGVYRIEFNSSFINGISSCQLRIMVNWTAGMLPLYENQTLVITVYTTSRDTVVDASSLPVTPYDEMLNLTLVFRDVITGDPIVPIDGKISVTIQESIPYTVFALSSNGGPIYVELDSSSWAPGTYTFHVNILWYGEPYYRNRTGIPIQITVRERNTDLTHGSYSPTQFLDNVVVVFTFRDLDDFTSLGMHGSTLTLDAWLASYYSVVDNLDGTYSVTLNASAFGALGLFVVNATIEYNGIRYCSDASDFFYLTVVQRRTQLTSELPDLAPYLSLANISLTYIDDATSQGIAGATITASCTNSTDPLSLGVNYFVEYAGSGVYIVHIQTTALGNFGAYVIDLTASKSGAPFYQSRIRAVTVEVSRRPTALTVTRSPLNTPFLTNATFEIVATDSLSGAYISLSKSSLLITHGSGTVLDQSDFSISGTSSGYTISVNSTVLSASLLSGYPITIMMFWGNLAPYYSNSTTATKVTTITRFTQVSVLSTPAADYFYNATATLVFNDYLTGTGIGGASADLVCSNDSSIVYWVVDSGDGSYAFKVDTTSLTGLGRYRFVANFTWYGAPYYQNRTGVVYFIQMNPVATALELILTPGVTFYLGETIQANITFTVISTGQGISGASVLSNWNILYGSGASISETGNGVYLLTINTAGLDATSYQFEISADKFLHVNRTVVAEVQIAALPIDVQVSVLPSLPIWGDVLSVMINVTDIRNGVPVTGASVNATFQSMPLTVQELGAGLYNCTILSAEFPAGDYSLTISVAETNYESRVREIPIRVSKLASLISAEVASLSAVNGQDVTISANYTVSGVGTSIPTGSVTYSWIGGTGTLYWNAEFSLYTGSLVIENVPVGSHSILVQASSTNYRSVSVVVTIEIQEIETDLLAFGGVTSLTAISGDLVNVTVYLNNTNLNLPVLAADVTYSVSNLTGTLTDIGGGYYSALIPTGTLDIRYWSIIVSGSKNGYRTSSIELTAYIARIPTRILFTGGALAEAYYGQNVTYLVQFWDLHNNVTIAGAVGVYDVEGVEGMFVEMANGTYGFTLNTTIASAGLLERSISIYLQRDRHQIAYSTLQLLILPIPTEIIADLTPVFPVNDDYSMMFIYNDTLNDELISDASASAIWEFGTTPLTYMGNGQYRFGPSETDLSRLDVSDDPYVIRIVISRGNYSRTEVEVQLTIRLIQTEVRFTPPPVQVFVGQEFSLMITFWDIDHDQAIVGAFNSTTGTQLSSVHGLDTDFGNGTYRFGFVGSSVQAYNLRITLGKDDHDSAAAVAVVFVLLSDEQQSFTRTLFGGMVVFLFIVGAVSAWVRVYSVPKMLRRIKKMIRAIEKGVIPTAPPVRDRSSMVLSMMNEDLQPIGIIKGTSDLSSSTVDVTIMDIESLLEELSAVIGLTPADIDVLKQDLEKMKPSERAGFISEVIKQERARRARDIAETSKAPEARAAVGRKPTEEELAVFKEKLLTMGIEETEADLMVEQARNLTKAEIDALLEQIGGPKE